MNISCIYINIVKYFMILFSVLSFHTSISTAETVDIATLWDAVEEDNIDGYRIYVKQDQSDTFIQVWEGEARQHTFLNVHLEENKQYTVCVRAYNQFGESDCSELMELSIPYLSYQKFNQGSFKSWIIFDETWPDYDYINFEDVATAILSTVNVCHNHPCNEEQFIPIPHNSDNFISLLSDLNLQYCVEPCTGRISIYYEGEYLLDVLPEYYVKSLDLPVQSQFVIEQDINGISNLYWLSEYGKQHLHLFYNEY